MKQDASLTYRLMRLVNSPMCAVRPGVNSIKSALLAVGEETFRRIATLAITSELSANQPAEILRMAFVRGRFCEALRGLCGLEERGAVLAGIAEPAAGDAPGSNGGNSSGVPLRREIRQALDGVRRWTSAVC